ILPARHWPQQTVAKTTKPLFELDVVAVERACDRRKEHFFPNVFAERPVRFELGFGKELICRRMVRKGRLIKLVTPEILSLIARQGKLHVEEIADFQRRLI